MAGRLRHCFARGGCEVSGSTTRVGHRFNPYTSTSSGACQPSSPTDASPSRDQSSPAVYLTLSTVQRSRAASMAFTRVNSRGVPVHDCSTAADTAVVTDDRDSDLVSISSSRTGLSRLSRSSGSGRRSRLFGGRSSADVRETVVSRDNNGRLQPPTPQQSKPPPSSKAWNRRSAIAGAINPSHWGDREYMKCVTFSKTKDHLRWTPLHYAAKKGFVQAAGRLLDDGISTEARTMEDRTALHIAAAEGQLGVVKLLLQRNANPSASDKQSLTPVALATDKNHFDVALAFFDSTRDKSLFAAEKSQLLTSAIWTGDKQKLRRLLQSNCDPNTTAGGPRPLRVAIEKADVEIVHILLQNGADPALRSVDGSLPLAAAVIRRAAEVVRLLVKHGADPHSISALGKSPFQIAMERDDKAILRILMGLDSGHVRAPSSEAYKKLSMLAVAIDSNNVDAVRMLLTGGADHSAIEVDGSTPLIRAAFPEKAAVMDLLLMHGADVNGEDQNGISPAHSVIMRTARRVQALRTDDDDLQQSIECEKSSIEILQTLMQYGADLHSPDRNGKNLLHLAAETGLKRTALFCLTNRFDISRADKSGWAALHWAAYGGGVSAAQLLRIRGASALQTDNYGLTPLLIASKYCHNDVALLLTPDSDVNHRDAAGRSALYYAASNENMLLVEHLLTNGAMAMEQDYNPTSPPSTPSVAPSTATGDAFLCKTRAAEICKLGASFELQQSHRLPNASNLKRLLAFGASPNTEVGGTPIACLAAMSHSDAAVKLLIDAGANVNIADRNGQTPLHIAASRGRADAVRALIAAGADLLARDTLSRTPEDVATKAGQSDVSMILNEARQMSARASPVEIQTATPARMHKPSLRVVGQQQSEATELGKLGMQRVHSTHRVRTLSPRHRLSGWAIPNERTSSRGLGRSASKAGLQTPATKGLETH